MLFAECREVELVLRVVGLYQVVRNFMRQCKVPISPLYNTFVGSSLRDYIPRRKRLSRIPIADIGVIFHGNRHQMFQDSERETYAKLRSIAGSEIYCQPD
jgi:hypothetical protein